MDPSRPDDEAFQEGAQPQGRRPPPPPGSEDDQPRHRPRRDDDRPRRPPQGDNDVVSSLIPYKNGQALAAYYLGVFSLIPCIGAALAVVALILGILGLNYAKKNPRAKGGGHAIAGIVLGVLSLVVHLAVVVLIAIGGFAANRGRP